MKIDPCQSPLLENLEPRNEEKILKFFNEKMQAISRESGTGRAFYFKRAALKLRRKHAFKLLGGASF